MNKLTGFAILVFAAFLLIVSSSFAKVAAQGNDSSSEKSTTTTRTCSPEQFKEQFALCTAIYALAHNKESSASAEKPVENLNLFSGAHNNGSSTSAEKPAESGTIISAPIEVKKGPTMEENNATAALTGEKLAIKKPAKLTYPSLFPSAKLSYTVSQDCHRTASGKLLCLATTANPRGGAYATGAINGAEAAKLSQNYDVNAICASFDFTDSKQWRDCKSGFHDAFNKITRENSPEQKPHKILQ
jgi:hypothetical protein